MTEDRHTGSAAPRSAARRSRRLDPGGPLPVEFYDRPADQVARELLGCRLVSEVGGVRVAGEIVETEAYTGPDDEASHAHIRFGITPRNRVMYGPPGIAYVYRIYGIHWCFNAVTCADRYPAAILVRALRLTEGIEAARSRRPGRPDRDLARGPANLCRALAIDHTLNGVPLQGPPVWIERGEAISADEVMAGPRIGITRAVDAPLRFWVRGSRYVSVRNTR